MCQCVSKRETDLMIQECPPDRNNESGTNVAARRRWYV